MWLFVSSMYQRTIFSGLAQCISVNGRGEINWRSIRADFRCSRWDSGPKAGLASAFSSCSSLTFVPPLPWAPRLARRPAR
jgi:hypothetical protein